MPYYEVLITGYKRLYVEAATEEDAMGNGVVDDEMSPMFGEVDWEADTASVTAEVDIDADEMKSLGFNVFEEES